MCIYIMMCIYIYGISGRQSDVSCQSTAVPTDFDDSWLPDVLAVVLLSALAAVTGIGSKHLKQQAVRSWLSKKQTVESEMYV